VKRSDHRILTTHVGSLPRPADLLDLLKAKVNGEPYDDTALSERVRSAVEEIVRRQVESGIDVVTDGEQGKPGFFAYVRERLTGFEPRSPRSGAPRQWAAEVAAFPEYYEQYFSRAMTGAAITPRVNLVGQLGWRLPLSGVWSDHGSSVGVTSLREPAHAPLAKRSAASAHPR
jgi:methionine synthase II (cobalamin-independent)